MERLARKVTDTAGQPPAIYRLHSSEHRDLGQTKVSIKALSKQKGVGTISKQRKLFRLTQNSQDMEENKKRKKKNQPTWKGIGEYSTLN